MTERKKDWTQAGRKNAEVNERWDGTRGPLSWMIFEGIAARNVWWFWCSLLTCLLLGCQTVPSLAQTSVWRRSDHHVHWKYLIGQKIPCQDRDKWRRQKVRFSTSTAYLSAYSVLAPKVSNPRIRCMCEIWLVQLRTSVELQILPRPILISTSEHQEGPGHRSATNSFQRF